MGGMRSSALALGADRVFEPPGLRIRRRQGLEDLRRAEPQRRLGDLDRQGAVARCGVRARRQHPGQRLADVGALVRIEFLGRPRAPQLGGRLGLATDAAQGQAAPDARRVKVGRPLEHDSVAGRRFLVAAQVEVGVGQVVADGEERRLDAQRLLPLEDRVLVAARLVQRGAEVGVRHEVVLGDGEGALHDVDGRAPGL